jgi:hypothetical protein
MKKMMKNGKNGKKKFKNWDWSEEKKLNLALLDSVRTSIWLQKSFFLLRPISSSLQDRPFLRYVKKSKNAKKHAFLTYLTLEIETHRWNWCKTLWNQWEQCLKIKKLFYSEGFTRVVFKIDHVKVMLIAHLS